MSAETMMFARGTTCTIQSRTMSLDSARSPTYSTASVYTDVPVNFQEKSGSESVRYGRENNRNFAIAFIPTSYTGVTTKHQVVFASRTWDIQHIRPRGVSGMTQHQEMELEETKP